MGKGRRSTGVTVEDIRRALEILNTRIALLPEVTCSVQIYSDGTGFVLGGLQEELAVFESDDQIIDIISAIGDKRTACPK